MNVPIARDGLKREGYVSLLAVSFAFGLAVFGSALAAGLGAYLSTAAREQRDVLDRITLESAANAALGQLAAGQSQSVRPTRLADVDLNRRQVSVEVSLPEGKYDLRDDTADDVIAAMQGRGFVLSSNHKALSAFDSLEAASRAWRLSADQEDCMRRGITLGRAPEAFYPEAASGKGEDQLRTVVAGDQVDVRVALERAGRGRVLWLRARFNGGASAWSLHDYRRLQVEKPCPTD